MPKGKRSSSDDYSEKLIPTRVTITRRRGNLKYVFEIDGFKGDSTGQVYYKGGEVTKIEGLLKSNNPFYSFTTSKLGVISGFETPLAIANESKSAGTLAGEPAIFSLQLQAETRSPQNV